MDATQWIGLLILGVSLGYIFGFGFVRFVYEVWKP